MGLFDGPTKSFARKMVDALQERAQAREEAAKTGGVDAPLHRFVSVALMDIRLIIIKVVELEQ